MAIRYLKPKGVEISCQPRPMLSTAEGGYVAVDETILSLWKAAHNRTLEEVVASFRGGGATSESTRGALACLAEGGLLEREGEEHRENEPKEPVGGKLVSAVVPITAQKELEWLGDCISSLFSQTYRDLEVIVVDNATSFGLSAWLEARHPRAKTVRLPERKPFATTVNRGVSQAQGAYFLVLNPDLKLGREAVAQMVMQVEQNPKCAAVAAKLRFWWTPSFLNGLGNRVRDNDWGTDNAIGHLDLGQFDAWEEVPSACFAATLIPGEIWADVGPIDEGFPGYYEDTEWCYRARLLGYSVRVAPGADIFHIFGGWMKTPGETSSLTPWKLRNAAYGRLRFAAKIVGPTFLRRFLRNYLREDIRNLIASSRKGDLAMVIAYLRAWWVCMWNLPRILKDRRALQARRACPDELLFGREEDTPNPNCWYDLPLLTWDVVVEQYLPLIQSKRTRPLPEFGPV